MVYAHILVDLVNTKAQPWLGCRPEEVLTRCGGGGGGQGGGDGRSLALKVKKARAKS